MPQARSGVTENLQGGAEEGAAFYVCGLIGAGVGDAAQGSLVTEEGGKARVQLLYAKRVSLGYMDKRYCGVREYIKEQEIAVLLNMVDILGREHVVHLAVDLVLVKHYFGKQGHVAFVTEPANKAHGNSRAVLV